MAPVDPMMNGSTRCHCCGWDAIVCAGGPTADEVSQTRRWMVAPIDIQPTNDGDEWHVGVCCWPCYWALEPDMWISEEMWSDKYPVVPFTELHLLRHASVSVDLYAYAWPIAG